MTETVDSLLDEYQRRYVARDAEGVTNLCLWPFLAIRKGAPIHLLDRNAVRDHFASMVQAYRFMGVDTTCSPLRTGGDSSRTRTTSSSTRTPGLRRQSQRP